MQRKLDKLEEEVVGLRIQHVRDEVGVRHEVKPYCGKTVVEVRLSDGSVFVGNAYCSILDQFNKKRGRMIAYGRALKTAATLRNA